MDWRKPKKIEDASKVDHGTIFYIEEGNPKGKLEEFKWAQEFTKEQEKIVIFLNDPINDPNGDVFTFKLELKQSSTLLELKMRASELFNIPMNEFVIKRKYV